MLCNYIVCIGIGEDRSGFQSLDTIVRKNLLAAINTRLTRSLSVHERN